MKSRTCSSTGLSLAVSSIASPFSALLEAELRLLRLERLPSELLAARSDWSAVLRPVSSCEGYLASIRCRYRLMLLPAIASGANVSHADL